MLVTTRADFQGGVGGCLCDSLPRVVRDGVEWGECNRDMRALHASALTARGAAFLVINVLGIQNRKRALELPQYPTAPC